METNARNIITVLLGARHRLPEISLGVKSMLILFVVPFVTWFITSTFYNQLHPHRYLADIDVAFGLVVLVCWLHPIVLIGCFFSNKAQLAARQYANYWLKMEFAARTSIIESWERVSQKQMDSNVMAFHWFLMRDENSPKFNMNKLARDLRTNLLLKNALSIITMLSFYIGAALVGVMWATQNRVVVYDKQILMYQDFLGGLQYILFSIIIINIVHSIWYGARRELPENIPLDIADPVQGPELKSMWNHAVKYEQQLQGVSPECR